MVKQVIRLTRGEHGGGLVQHQDARVVVQVARNLHHLLLANAKGRHGRGRVDVGQANLGQLLAGGRVQRIAAQPAGAVGQAAHEQVLGYRQGGDQPQLLHHHAHTVLFGIAARGGGVGLPTQAHTAPRGRLQSADDLGQRALARAVLARQGQHLARVQGQRHVVEHGGGVVLAHGVDGQQGRRGRGGGVGRHGRGNAFKKQKRRAAVRPRASDCAWLTCCLWSPAPRRSSRWRAVGPGASWRPGPSGPAQCRTRLAWRQTGRLWPARGRRPAWA